MIAACLEAAPGRAPLGKGAILCRMGISAPRMPLRSATSSQVNGWGLPWHDMRGVTGDDGS